MHAVLTVHEDGVARNVRAQQYPKLSNLEYANAPPTSNVAKKLAGEGLQSDYTGLLKRVDPNLTHGDQVKLDALQSGCTDEFKTAFRNLFAHLLQQLQADRDKVAM